MKPILVGVASSSLFIMALILTEQIRNFYGPLSGNRLVYNSSYVCVTQCKHVSMYEWLEAAQEIIFNSFFALFCQHPHIQTSGNLIKHNLYDIGRGFIA